MNRLRARVFSLVAAFAVAAAALLPAAAQEAGTPMFWFAGTRLIFDRAVPLDGDVAVSIRDSGLQRFLGRLGATIAYQPLQRYVIVTAADHRTITFTMGSAVYLAGSVTARATFAPFIDDNQPIVPLYALAHALYVEPVAGAGETILQPQIAALDIRTQGATTQVVIRGATALAYVKRIDEPTHVEFAFSGISSTLTGTRRVGAAITATIATGGTPRNPSTIVDFDAPHGLTYVVTPPATPNELALALGEGSGPVAVAPPSAPPVIAAATPIPTPPPPVVLNASPPPIVVASPVPSASTLGSTEATPAAAGPAVVTAVTLQPLDDGLTIHVVLSGTAAYDWHRLRRSALVRRHPRRPIDRRRPRRASQHRRGR